jgi:hypothetical protein
VSFSDSNPSERLVDLPKDIRLIRLMLRLPDAELRAAVNYLATRLEARQQKC